MSRIRRPRAKPKARQVNPFLWLLPLAVVLSAVVMWLATQSSEQTADLFWKPSVEKPRYSAGTGPVVCVDEAHRNYHIIAGRYAPFARLLEADGYTVRPFRQTVRGAAITACRVLVIANATAELETDGIERWVRDGGSLLLIADHTPYAEAAESTGAAFGFRMSKGFVADIRMGEDLFVKSNGTLTQHAVTEGLDRIRTFLGQAITAPADATPILILGKGYRVWKAREAFNRRMVEDSESAEGLCQLAVKQHGRGRIAVSGEAAMFSAQIDPGLMRQPMGMNAPGAEQNALFALNLMRWLEGAR